MKKSNKDFDVIIVGGGFYGCALALFLSKYVKKITILEKEKDLILRASYNNQARIHNGYHYPRSFLTALRSHQNYQRFIKDWNKCVYGNYKQYYAIASDFSKTTSQQFFRFCGQLGSPIKRAPESVRDIFDKNLIEDVFEAEEIVFDAGEMRKIVREELEKKKIEVFCESQVESVKGTDDGVICNLKNGKTIIAKKVFNCSYSGINNLLIGSGLEPLGIKEEFIEMPLMEVHDDLKKISVTVLDGPFFGFLPFPDRDCHSLWHVRYSIRANWTEPVKGNLEKELRKISKKSNWIFMKKDMQRYIPLLGESKYLESIYETKTVLLEKEDNDARPILFRKDYGGIDGFYIVLGGKIDNIYDIMERIKEEAIF